MHGSNRSSLMLLILGLLLVPSGMVANQIYRTVDEHGNVVFTDIPPRDDQSGEQIVVETPNSFAIEEAGDNRELWVVDADEEPEAPEFSYQSLQVTAPQHDESIRENAGNVTISGVANPRLRPGHKVRLVMNGEPVQESRQPQFDLQNVDRGTHSVALEIVDERGKVLMRSAESTFHLQRFRLPTPRPS